MLSKRYESTEVDRRTWLHVPSGTHWSTSSDTHKEVEIQIETSTKMYTPIFESDWINDIDHMRISGTEPSSVILSQTSNLKSWKVTIKKCLNKPKPKGMV